MAVTGPAYGGHPDRPNGSQAAPGPQTDPIVAGRPSRARIGTSVWELPEFRLQDLDGTTRVLADWKGRVILLNFWASWCGPCLYEIKDFIRYQQRHAAQGLQIVGLGLDTARKLRNVARTLGIDYPVLVADPGNRRLLRTWGNAEGFVPYSVIIDRSGHIVHLQRGQVLQESFDTLVLPLLGGCPRMGAVASGPGAETDCAPE